MRTIDLKLLAALDAVISEQNFDRAASVLSITQSAISQRIKQLEQLVAHPVLIRTQPLTLTPIGVKLIKYYKQVNLLEHQLNEDIFPSSAKKVVSASIALNADTLASWFIPAITPLLKLNNIELDLHLANEQETQKLLIKGEVFAAISSQKKAVSGCNTQFLGELNYLLVCSPEFKEKYFPTGLTTESLTQAPAVDFDPNDNMHATYLAKVFKIQPGSYPCHRVRSSEAFVKLALAGLAYTLLPITQAIEHLNSGTLVSLAPEKPLTQKLYWHSWVLEKGLHKALSEQVINYAQKILSE